MTDRLSYAPDASTPPGMPRVTRTADGVLRFDYSPCASITLQAVEYALARHGTLAPGRRSPVLLLGGRVANVEHAAQRFASAPEVCAVTAALGLVARSFLEHHLARMFLLYHRPPYPARVFRNEDEALAWLRSFLPPA